MNENEKAVEKLKMIRKQYNRYEITHSIDLAIKALEERPTVEWIIENDVYCICPFCNFKDVKYSNYCPDCGAKMERREE